VAMVRLAGGWHLRAAGAEPLTQAHPASALPDREGGNTRDAGGWRGDRLSLSLI
jgi:hypothetical protein